MREQQPQLVSTRVILHTCDYSESHTCAVATTRALKTHINGSIRRESHYSALSNSQTISNMITSRFRVWARHGVPRGSELGVRECLKDRFEGPRSVSKVRAWVHGASQGLVLGHGVSWFQVRAQGVPRGSVRARSAQAQGKYRSSV